MQDKSGHTPVVFHILCGLAGGTGSGAVIDAVAQIRKKFPDPEAHRIMVYAYVPDLNPPPQWNTGNYHANAYAALVELNALSAGAWSPHDVVAGGGPVKADYWFNGCYVFSDDNDQGYRANIDGELPVIVADFIYQKSIGVSDVSWDSLGRFENSENGDSSPEASKGARTGQRSVRFLSFGIRRIAFPEETINEYLTFDFANQVYRQLEFNNWQDGIGFIESPKPNLDNAYVADAKQREDWKLSDDHLRLSRPILESEGTKRWRGFDIEWGEFETHYVRLVQEDPDRVVWLNNLKKSFQTA